MNYMNEISCKKYRDTFTINNFWVQTLNLNVKKIKQKNVLANLNKFKTRIQLSLCSFHIFLLNSISFLTIFNLYFSGTKVIKVTVLFFQTIFLK